MKINSDAIIGALQQLKDDEVLECRNSGDEISLSPVKKSSLSFGRKIQTFFGFGPFQLQTVRDLFSQAVTDPAAAATIPTDAVEKLNRRIEHYNTSGLRKYFSCLKIRTLEIASAQKVITQQVVEEPKGALVLPKQFAEVYSKLLPFSELGAKRHRQKACKEAFDALLQCLESLAADKSLYQAVAEAKFGKNSLTILHLASHVQRADVVEKILDIEGLAALFLQNNSGGTPLDLACDKATLAGEINLQVIAAFFEKLNFDLLDQMLSASRQDMLHTLLQQCWSLYQTSPEQYAKELPSYKELLEQVLDLENIELVRKFLFAENVAKNSSVAAACLLSGQRWVVDVVVQHASDALLLEVLKLPIHVGNDEYPIVEYIYGLDDEASRALTDRIAKSADLQGKMAKANLRLPEAVVVE